MQKDPTHPWIRALWNWTRSTRVQSLHFHTSSLDLRQPKLMAIWNVTPDSFSSPCDDHPAEISHAQKLLDEGADILDIGAESTNPHSKPLPEAVEIERLRGPLTWARQNTKKFPISLDSYHLATLTWAIREFDIDIINDVACSEYPSAEREDLIYGVAREAHAGLILMAWNAFDEESQAPDFDTCIRQILLQLSARLDHAFACGLDMRTICTDPGIGFGKGMHNDLQLITKAPHYLATLGRPVLIAHSRKRCLSVATGLSGRDIDSPTATATAMAFLQGASMVRIHNVRLNHTARALFLATRS